MGVQLLEAPKDQAEKDDRPHPRNQIYEIMALKCKRSRMIMNLRNA